MDKKVLFDNMISTIVWSAAALHIQQISLVKGRGRLEGPFSLGKHALSEHATGRRRLDPSIFVFRRLGVLLFDLGIN